MGSARVSIRSADAFRVEATNGHRTLTVGMAPPGAGKEAAAALDPHETLLAALGGCTSMTVMGYARHKGWPLEGVEADLSWESAPVAAGEAPEKIGVTLRFAGPLDDAQRARLVEIAKKCPVHKTLLSELEITERLA